MQISNQNSGISSLARQNILEKANQAFSGGEKAEDFSKKINAEPICHAKDKNTTKIPKITSRRLILSRRSLSLSSSFCKSGIFQYL